MTLGGGGGEGAVPYNYYPEYLIIRKNVGIQNHPQSLHPHLNPHEHCVVHASSNLEMSTDTSYHLKNTKYTLYGTNNIKIENFEWWF